MARKKEASVRLLDQQLLTELLLAIGFKGDARVVSSEAINLYGDLKSVLRQNGENLKKVKGLMPKTVRNLKMVSSIFSELNKPERFSNQFEGMSYFMWTASFFDSECYRILYLDHDYCIKKDFIVQIAYHREIVKEALENEVFK